MSTMRWSMEKSFASGEPFSEGRPSFVSEQPVKAEATMGHAVTSSSLEGFVREAMAGDRQALLRLLEAVRPDIRRYARASCRMADVDDAIQDSLWLLYRRVGTLRAASSLSAWLFAVVKRECLRLARQSGIVAADDQGGQRGGGQAWLGQSDETLRLDLASAIQSLPEHYRRLVIMRDIEERTIDEMAASLGLTRESVKARLHRARALLREYLLR